MKDRKKRLMLMTTVSVLGRAEVKSPVVEVDSEKIRLSGTASLLANSDSICVVGQEYYS